MVDSQRRDVCRSGTDTRRGAGLPCCAFPMSVISDTSLSCQLGGEAVPWTSMYPPSSFVGLRALAEGFATAGWLAATLLLDGASRIADSMPRELRGIPVAEPMAEVRVPAIGIRGVVKAATGSAMSSYLR